MPTEEFANVSHIKRKRRGEGNHNYRVSRCQAQILKGIRCWEGEKREQNRCGNGGMYTLLSGSSMGTTQGAFLLPQAANPQRRCKRRVTAASSPAASLAREPQADAQGAGDHQELPILLLSRMLQCISERRDPVHLQRGSKHPSREAGTSPSSNTSSKSQGREWAPAAKGGFAPCAQRAMGEHRSSGIPSSPPLPAQEMGIQRQSNIPCH